MARPKTIKVGLNEEIVLKNITPELTAQITALVKGAPAKTEAPVATSTTDLAVTTSVLTHKAVGTFQNENGMWCVAEVSYNPSTKEAKLTDVEVCSEYRDDSVTAFKIRAVKSKII